jgi:hypothetical protein
VTLQRGPQGWQVAERSFPADGGKLRKLLLDLASLERVEEKTRDPQRHAVLGVEAPDSPAATGTLIELWSAGAPESQPSFALIAGKSAGSREFYARRPADVQSWMLRPTVTVDAQPARWLDTSLIDLKAEEIRELQGAVAGTAEWRLSRAAAAEKTMALESPPGRAAATADETAVTGLLGSFANLGLDDVRSGSASTPRDRLRVATFEGLALHLEGLVDGDKRWIRLRAESTSDGARAKAAALQSRAAGREFEVQTWKYDGIFRKAEELRAKPAGS